MYSESVTHFNQINTENAQQLLLMLIKSILNMLSNILFTNKFFH